MTMTDDDVEARVRATFQAVATATAIDGRPLVGASSPRRSRVAALVAAALLVVAGLAAAAVLRDGPPTPVTSGPPIVPLPPGIPAEHGVPIFWVRGTPGPDAVATAYLADRVPGATAEPAVVDDLRATVRWRTDEAAGTVLLGQSSTGEAQVGTGQWWVAAAWTDSVDTSTLVHRDGHVRGAVRTTSALPFRIDVTWDRGDMTRIPGEQVAAVDVHVGREAARVLVQLRDDGRPVSVTELRLDLGMPTDRRVIGSGSWAGGQWTLVALGASESDLFCMSLEGTIPGSTGCGAGGGYPDHSLTLTPLRDPIGGEVLLRGQAGPSITRIVVRAAGHDDVEAPTYRDPLNPRLQAFVVVAVPAVDSVEIEAYAADGTSFGTIVVHPLTGKSDGFTPHR